MDYKLSYFLLNSSKASWKTRVTFDGSSTVLLPDTSALYFSISRICQVANDVWKSTFIPQMSVRLNELHEKHFTNMKKSSCNIFGFRQRIPQLTKLELPGDHTHGCRVKTIMPTPSWPEEGNSEWCTLSHSRPSETREPSHFYWIRRAHPTSQGSFNWMSWVRRENTLGLLS